MLMKLSEHSDDFFRTRENAQQRARANDHTWHFAGEVPGVIVAHF